MDNEQLLARNQELVEISHPANRIGPGNVLRLYELRDKAGVKC